MTSFGYTFKSMFLKLCHVMLFDNKIYLKIEKWKIMHELGFISFVNICKKKKKRLKVSADNEVDDNNKET